MPKKPYKKEPELPMPVDKSVYDVAIDYALIDYIANDLKLERFPEQEDGLKKSHSVSLRADGWSNADIAKGLGISRATMEIWEKTDPLYKACIDFVHGMETKDLEQRVWHRALTDGKSENLPMFCVKSELPKYRDNAPMPTASVTQIRITINDKDFDVIATSDPKQIESGYDE